MSKFYDANLSFTRASFQYRLVCLAVVAFSTASHAQTAPVPEPLKAPSTSLVLVPTIVRSASGDLISGLKADDFRVTDDGISKTVHVDGVDAENIALVVAMQTGKHTPAQLQSYEALTRFVGAMFGTSIPRVALVTFDSRVDEIWNFPPRLDGLKYAFTKTASGGDGAAIMDALNCAADLLKSQPSGFRRVVLLLSQADDDASKTDPISAVQQLGENNVTVYSVAFETGKKHAHSNRKYPKSSAEHQPPKSPEAEVADAALKSVATKLQADTSGESAELTGGEHIWLNDVDQLQTVLSTLRNDFANTYILSFEPDSKLSGFHSIGVQLRDRSSKASIAAREAYWQNND